MYDDNNRAIRKILSAKGNLMIWGLGKDSPFWHNITSGKVIFIGENTHLRKTGNLLDDEIIQKYPFLEVYRVRSKINTDQSFVKYVNHPETWHELDLCDQLPNSVIQTHWHVIVVQSSHGCCGIGPRRCQSIYTSWKLANKGTHILIDDFDNKVEQEFSLGVLGKPQEITKTQNKTFTKYNEQAHFIVSADNVFTSFTVESGMKSNEMKLMEETKNTNVEYDWVLLLTVNNGYFDFFNNWRLHFVKLNISLPVYVIAEDNIVYNKLINIKDIGMTVQRSEYISINTSVIYDSILYKKMVSARPKYILSFMKKGMNIIYSDLDSVWLKNPLPYFTGNFDIWSQVDSEPMSIFCTGLLAIKNNKSTLRIVRRWHMILKRRPDLNQPIFNQLLKYSSVKLKPLDIKRFPPGNLYFERFTDEERAGVVVVHNNWIRGHENKLKRFKKMKLWFNNTIL
jgi:rhamnogalacturonan II specific xylosyltransferase